MAFGPVLYGVNLYSQHDYSMDPKLIWVGDSFTMVDSPAVTVNVPLADSMSAPTDALTAALTVVLNDSVSPTDAKTIQAIVVLADSMITKEFITPILKRSQQWIMGGKSRTITPHIYGQVLYAKNMYSTNIAILWAQVKKDLGPGFTNQNGHKYNS